MGRVDRAVLLPMQSGRSATASLPGSGVRPALSQPFRGAPSCGCRLLAVCEAIFGPHGIREAWSSPLAQVNGDVCAPDAAFARRRGLVKDD